MPGEVVGLVGESGCGKSTLGRVVAGVHEASAGEMHFEGTPLSAMNTAQRRAANLAVQMIFQDPMSSLNPRMRVLDIVGEAPRVHGMVPAADIDDYVAQTLLRVGLDPSYRSRYPHQFSGGQRARIGIARALAVQPRFLVCDESVAALDVSIQAQVLNLFMDLRRDLNLTYLFISHDLGVVRHISDRVVIMYLGRVVESAPASRIFSAPRHPYTQALLDAMPIADPLLAKQQRAGRHPLVGELPSPMNPPNGCRFHTRCPECFTPCALEEPALLAVAGNNAHVSACHLSRIVREEGIMS
jgi:peptide/nickel transport system ATP-binding protein